MAVTCPRSTAAFGSLFALVFSVGTAVLTAADVIQWKGLLLLPVEYMYVSLAAFYIQPARQLQRLTRTAHAPRLNHLSESIDGGSALRAFGPEPLERYKSSNFQKLDEANKIWYAQLCVSQWLSLRIQLIGSVLVHQLAGGAARPTQCDGVDVSHIGLQTLREELAIIPQNPVLFKGTLRAYLDPFGEFGDDEPWTYVRQVGLGDRIGSEEKKLQCAVEENGDNLNVDERQMLCMACALLRRSRIVVFDETIAAIGHETDQKLQRVIREAFAESTMLTIAHRLDTIRDLDRILALGNGALVEFVSPSGLVKKGSGHFYELMQEGGYLDKFLRRVDRVVGG